jgi:hypothetical protein
MNVTCRSASREATVRPRQSVLVGHTFYKPGCSYSPDWPHNWGPYGTGQPARTRASTALVLRSMVRMGPVLRAAPLERDNPRVPERANRLLCLSPGDTTSCPAPISRVHDGRVLVRWRANARTIPMDVQNVAVKCRFYEIEDAGGARFVAAEEALAGLEGAVVQAIRRIDRTEAPPDVGTRERTTLAAFMALQLTRTPEQRNGCATS